MSTELQTYRQLMLLTAESAGLEWDGNGSRIREIAAAADQLRGQLHLPSRDVAPEANGLYWCSEELSHVYFAGEVEPWPFIFHALDFIARQLECHTAQSIHNLDCLARLLGPEAVCEAFTLAEGMAENLRQEHRRFETVECDEESGEERTIFAKLTEADERFDEAPSLKCEPDAEGATLITLASLDMDVFGGLEELMMSRDAAARRAMRGEAP